MKNKYAIHLGRIVVLVIKILLFVALFVSFFALFAIDNPQIVSKSRTAAITMTTFFVLGLTMTAVYGGFAIGKKKSKPIIYSLGIATFITDFITYFQLIIMNTNRYNQNDFRIKNIGVFFLVLLIQVIFIVIFTYLGNYIYFKVNPPEKCLVICDDIKNAQALIKKIEKYKKQYKIEKIIEYNSDILKESIRNCDTVFISNVPALEKSEIIEYSYRRRKSVYSNMELYDVVSIFSKTTILDDTPMAYSNVRGLTFEQRFFKRIVDIVLSSIGLIIASPIMLIEALSIKLYDKGPVFFKQERATLNGKPFNVLKFRTMIVNADNKLARENDDRITPVGKILRKLRIDELPQLINILKGDMSVVGPRPEQTVLTDLYETELPEFKYRLRVKAGLTGLAQIEGKYNTTPKDKLILDLMYIEKYSVWNDFAIMLQTLKIFFKSDSTEGIIEEKK